MSPGLHSAHTNQLLEDHPLWDAGFVATESGWFVFRLELAPISE